MPIDVDRLRNALADRYAIDREIGRGGMATVFLAEDLKHGRRVAVKVLEPELASSLGSDRFLREIETAARLNHPHIVGLIESGDADGFLYYVMPYMAGDSLRDRLDRERELPVDEAVQIAREVASGLDHAHEQGIVHRDIKPGNIMLSGGHAVVADFGIARAVDEAGGERVTKTGISLGSPIYMSPEQAAGSETVDGRTDIYALGCVVYEMLAGEPPYSGKSTASIVARKQLETAPRLGELRETVPAGVEDAVARALARSPADRFASAGEFADALEAPSEPRQRQRSSIARTVIAAAFVIAIAATGWLLGPGSRVTPAEASDLRSIAVLPFENRSTGEESELFSKALHEDILAQLTKIDSLDVISSASVARYADSDKTTAEIADELGVSTVLHGSFQQAGDQIRINLQLIAAEDEQNMWAETYNEALTTANIFTIQADVARSVAAALRTALSPDVAVRIDARPTDNLEAYGLYARGRQFLGQSTPLGFETAAEYFRKAIELDSTYAPAWAGLASSYSLSAAWHYMPWEEAVPVARQAAERALELDETLAEAHTALGVIYQWFDGDFVAAERETLRARQLDPSSVSAHSRYASFLRWTGRLEEGLVALGRVRELNPLSGFARVRVGELLLQMSRFDDALADAEGTIRLLPGYAPGYAMKAFSLMALGRFDEARAPAERAIELNSRTGFSTALGWLLYWQGDYEGSRRQANMRLDDNPLNRDAWFLLGAASTELGRYDDAVAAWERVFELQPEPFKRLLAAYAWARSGNEEKAREILTEVQTLEDDPRWVNALADAALVYGVLGDNDRAFQLLDQAVEARARGVEYLMMGLWWLQFDPRADPLRDDPRWDVLMRRVGPPE